MVARLMARDRGEYKQKLSSFIAGAIVREDKKILFIDCMNCLNQYLFRRKDLGPIMERLYFARIELCYDLLDLLKNVHFNEHFKGADVLLISSFDALLADLTEDEQDHHRTSIDKILLRLEEKYQKDVVVIGIEKRWDTQFRLNEW